MFTFGLIPTENWEYNLRDVSGGFFSLIKKNDSDTTIDIEGIGSCIPVRSGRAAIVAAIKSLELKPDTRIAVPLYSCPAVFKAIEAVGCKPVFIDIERETYCMSANDLSKKIDRVHAVIAIHMFGNLCDMQALIRAAKGKPIIEDCAQSLGSKFNGNMAGTLGTIGIFSFRSGKYLSVGEGGAVYSSDPNINSRLVSIISEMNIPSKAEEMKHIIKTYIRTRLRTRPLFGLIGRKIWKMYNKSVSYASKTPIIISKMLYPDLRLTCKRLVDFDRVIERQRKNADYFTSNLKFSADMLCFERDDTFYNRFAYPLVFVSIEQRDAMAEYLFMKNIDTVRPYQDSVELGTDYYGYHSDCPVTERVSKCILLIPGYYKLKQHEIHYITKCLNEGWDIISSRQRNGQFHDSEITS